MTTTTSARQPGTTDGQIGFTADQLALERDVHALLTGPLGRPLVARAAADGPARGEALGPLHRLLGARGWLAPGWPREYGGLGLGPVETAIVHRELVRNGVPDLLFVVSICYVGTCLLLAGNDTVNRTYLPALAAGELTSCTLYSEPDTGSDLASLASRAERVEGGYRLHGRKTYSQATEHAGYALVAARLAEAGASGGPSDGAPPAHAGITLFWVSLHAPGVTVRPEPNLGEAPFSTVLLDGVFVPGDHVIGPPGEAWSLLNTALSIERTGFEAHLKMRHWLDAVDARAAALGLDREPWFAGAAAVLDARVEAGGHLAWQMIGKQARRQLDGPGAAIAKWYNTELGRPIARLALDVEAAAGTVVDAPAGPGADEQYRECPGLTLSAGTSEIMLYAVATGHLRVQIGDAPPLPLDDPDAAFRRRLRRFVGTAFAAEIAAAGPGTPTGAPRTDPAAAWQALVRSGTVGLTLPPAAGGAGHGVVESLVVAEELGRALVRGPYLATVAVAEAAAADGSGGSGWPLALAVAGGTVTAAVAGEVTADVPATGPPDAPVLDGGTVSGAVALVAHADVADVLVAPAWTPAGPVLVTVRRDQPGVRLRHRTALGHEELFAVTFDRAAVEPGGVLCEAGSPTHAALVERLRLRQCGYLLGLSAQAFDLTLTRAKTRRQFGQPIAAFQHVSFRLAALAARLHAARVLVRARAAEHDAGRLPEPARGAAVLALVAQVARDVTAEGVQLHGAHGMTRAAAIGRFYHRAAAETVVLGGPHAMRSAAAG
ncbi:acyl-CoA dehydrogenase family protein [Micromonospora aurantiaca (nom. illeg.)]|uniref:acyl-CoA dehydrogenase family protein n=1 Tax=Micromonospora aurantiaca (nom. illeg.) TaxID=47850 RepID=UPI0033DB27C4